MSDALVVKSRFFEEGYRVTFADVRERLPEILEYGDVILVDRALLEAHSDRLAVLADFRVIEVDASEHAKSFEAIGDTIETVMEVGFRRGNRLVAVGGGVVQDVVAFIATTIYRGVDWLFVPTTLLAQGDSCIGGKSSINFRGYKNLLGSFLPPREIVVDVGFVPSLPDSELTSGLGEILHFLIYSSEEDFELLEHDFESIRGDAARLEVIARRSLAIKKEVIERDELDTGERNLFNYGHSFGHAIEAVTDYGIPHGIAVSMGIDIANFLSAKRGIVPEDFRNRVRKLASKLWPGYSIRDVDLDAYFAALRRDKKNVGTDVNVILCHGFGGLEMMTIDLDGDDGQWLRDYFATEAP